MIRWCVSGNKNGGGAVRLGLRFLGQNYQYFKTLVFFLKRYSTIGNCSSYHHNQSALPRLQRIAPVIYMLDKGDGQNRPSASDVSATGASTTPPSPQQVLVQAASAVSSITNAATSSSGNTASGDDTNDTPRKQGGGSLQNYSSVDSRHVTIVIGSILGRTTLPLRLRCHRCHHCDTCIVVVDNGNDR